MRFTEIDIDEDAKVRWRLAVSDMAYAGEQSGGPG